MSKPIPFRLSDLKIHPFLAAMNMPHPNEGEAKRLREDMKRRGLDQPLWVIGKQVVDGRRRLEQAAKLGWERIDCREIPKDQVLTRDHVEAFVLNSALVQKALSEDQRVIIALDLIVKLKAIRQSEAGKIAAAAKRAKRVGNGSNTALETKPKTDTWKEIAQSTGVAIRKLQRANRLKREAPELYQRVRNGETVMVKRLRNDAKPKEVVLTLEVAEREHRKLAKVKKDQDRIEEAKKAPSLEPLIQGDCAKVIPTLPLDQFRLLLCDPAWGLNYMQPSRTASLVEPIANDATPEQALDNFRRMVGLVTPQMKAESAAMLILPWRLEAEFRRIMEDNGWTTHQKLYLVKHLGTFSPGKWFQNRVCEVLFCHRGKSQIYPLESARTTHIDCPEWVAGEGNELHSCRIPPSVLVRLIKLTTLPGEWVLDPMCGSGSAIEAAWECGRKAVGVEIDQKNYGLAKWQLDQWRRAREKVE